jgi:hypothetical protein
MTTRRQKAMTTAHAEHKTERVHSAEHKSENKNHAEREPNDNNHRKGSGADLREKAASLVKMAEQIEEKYRGRRVEELGFDAGTLVSKAKALQAAISGD